MVLQRPAQSEWNASIDKCAECLPPEARDLHQPLKALHPPDTLAGCAVGVRNTCAYLGLFWKLDANYIAILVEPLLA